MIPSFPKVPSNPFSKHISLTNLLHQYFLQKKLRYIFSLFLFFILSFFLSFIRSIILFCFVLFIRWFEHTLSINIQNKIRKEKESIFFVSLYEMSPFEKCVNSPPFPGNRKLQKCTTKAMRSTTPSSTKTPSFPLSRHLKSIRHLTFTVRYLHRILFDSF